MTLPRRVQLVEVGPRDGLQNETAQIPTAEKVAFVVGSPGTELEFAL